MTSTDNFSECSEEQEFRKEFANVFPIHDNIEDGEYFWELNGSNIMYTCEFTDREISLVIVQNGIKIVQIRSYVVDCDNLPNPTTWKLATLFIKEEFQRQGLGTYYMKKLRSILMSRGINELQIYASGSGEGITEEVLNNFYNSFAIKYEFSIYLLRGRGL